MTFDVLIRGGLVFDGLGREPVGADVGVCGRHVAAMGQDLDGQAGDVIDASGLAVAPGFVDVHAHGDLTPLMCPEAASRLHDGVTTELVGNCGASAFPQSDEMAAHSVKRAAAYGIPGEWRTVDDFADAHEAVASAINRGTLIGHTTLRQAVMGEADRAPTDAEMASMCRLTEQAMDMGAFGMSSGLIYAPGMYATPEEIAALAAIVARGGGLYTSHLRSESGDVEEAVDEFIDVGRATGVRLQHSHVKVSGEANWAKFDRVLARIERAREDGLDLGCDRYPYTASSTGLSALLPGWAREGGRDELVKRLHNPRARDRMVADMWSGRALGTQWQGVMIANAHADDWRHLEGRTVADLAAEAGCEPAEMALDILRHTDGSASVVCFSMSEDNLIRWLRLPFVAIGSDGTTRGPKGPTAVGKPHPRSFGTWSRFLGRYVRDKRIMPLREAIRRITSLPASRMGLTKRGVLSEGACADITVFDPDTIEDRATYQAPLQCSVGVRHVLVNGSVALRNGTLTAARAGSFLRRGDS